MQDLLIYYLKGKHFAWHLTKIFFEAKLWNRWYAWCDWCILSSAEPRVTTPSHTGGFRVLPRVECHAECPFRSSMLNKSCIVKNFQTTDAVMAIAFQWYLSVQTWIGRGCEAKARSFFDDSTSHTHAKVRWAKHFVFPVLHLEPMITFESQASCRDYWFQMKIKDMNLKVMQAAQDWASFPFLPLSYYSS